MKPLAALRALGPGPEPDAHVKERVYGALLASLEGAAAAGAASAVAALPSKGPATVAPAAAPLLAGMTSSKALLVAGAIWLIGGATGAALYGALRREPVHVVYVDRPVLAAPSTVSSQQPEAAARELLPSIAAPAHAPSSQHGAVAPPGSAKSMSSELAQERALLDSARANAARGEPALVLEQVAQHAREFPQGRLGEEREALAIRALLALGRSGEARARAEAFRAAYPRSFLLPVIDSALSAP